MLATRGSNHQRRVRHPTMPIQHRMAQMRPTQPQIPLQHQSKAQLPIPLQPTLTLQGHRNRIRAIAEVGTGLVSGSADRTVKLWSQTESRFLATFTDYDGEVYDVRAVNDSTVIAVSRNRVQVLRVSDGRVLAESNAFPNDLRSCAVLGTSTAVVGDIRGCLLKFHMGNRKIGIMKRYMNAHASGISRIFTRGDEILPDKFATCSSDGTAKLWDADSLSILRTFRGHEQAVLCVTYNESFFVTGSRDTTVRVYSITTANHLCTIHTHTELVRFLHIIPNTNIVCSGGTDSLIALHMLPNGNLLAKFDIGMKASAFSLLSSGTIAVGGTEHFDIRMFNINELKQSSSRMNQDSCAYDPLDNVNGHLNAHVTGHHKYLMPRESPRQSSIRSANQVKDEYGPSNGHHVENFMRPPPRQSQNPVERAEYGSTVLELTYGDDKPFYPFGAPGEGSSGIQTNPGLFEGEEPISDSQRETAVRHQFRAYAVGKGKQELNIVEGTSAMNVILDILGIEKKIVIDEFETLFLGLSEELNVSESTFIKLFHAVLKGRATADAEYLEEAYGEQFDNNNSGRQTIGVEFATRMLRHACNGLKQRGLIDAATLAEADINLQVMQSFCEGQDQKMGRAQFVLAALSIVHNIEK